MTVVGNRLDFGMPADTNLYRSAADNLKTDDTFWALQLVSLQNVYVDYNNGNNKIIFGSAQDTNLYRNAANYLKTDGHFRTGGELRVYTDVVVNENSGKVYFGSALDTNLYRGIAGMLRTDGGLIVRGDQLTAVKTGVGSGYGGISFLSMANREHPVIWGYAGSYIAQFAQKPYVADPYATWDATSSVRLTIGSDGALWFGSSLDVVLYRSAANQLRTDNQFVCSGDLLYMGYNSGQGQWNAYFDTSAAAYQTPLVMWIPGHGMRRVILGPPDQPFGGYRILMVTN